MACLVISLFFWMLASALLLFYRSVRVFGGGLSKNTMLAIGFSLGYGAPLIITVITIAVTAPNDAYIRENVICWLNWDKSRALLAFVVPALIIVFVNIIILIVVIVKILQSRGMTRGANEDEKYVLVVIIRSLAILTPFFGITWGLGVGILVDPTNLGIHITFAFFNSLQGFFILVFGTLLDKKVCTVIVKKKKKKNAMFGLARRPHGAEVASLILSVSVWVFSGYSGFLPHSKNMHGRLIEHSKLSRGLSVSGFLSSSTVNLSRAIAIITSERPHNCSQMF
uniref:G-protein coupled receptors family 2 profile 2 domain-containing protein n=1 Tax=Hippocampus comes TaxID=109280 RepID=A0A3Q2YTH4_HIPCM